VRVRVDHTARRTQLENDGTNCDFAEPRLLALPPVEYPLVPFTFSHNGPPSRPQFAKLKVQRTARPLPKCPDDQLGFGKVRAHGGTVRERAGAPRARPILFSPERSSRSE